MDEKAAEKAHVIVALAASAAATAPLQRFLSNLETLDGMALVVVFQHREALDDQALLDVAGERSRYLDPIRDGAAILPGKIYIGGQNQLVSIEGGRFRSQPAENEPGHRGTVDNFLVSLAREEDARAIAVIFPMIGGDGALGVTAIKEAGGLALVEESERSQVGDLTTSNSPAGLADVILPAEDLAKRVIAHAQRLLRTKDPGDFDPDAPELFPILSSVANVLRTRTGHDFHGYKRGTFLRRVRRRMQVLGCDELSEYLEALRAQPDESQQLFNDLLIGVTQFFRDAKEFQLLEGRVVPQLFDGKKAGDQLRVWVIGCSTGQEAYSLAILLREYMAKMDDPPQVQVFASDIDGRALAAARAGRYADSATKEVSPERLARWFIKEGSTYCVVKDLREMCIFSQHSIIKDAPFSRIDLVSCRNLLIYLDADLQGRVIPLLHFSLKPGGFLFLGNSENVPRHANLFAPLEGRSRIFRRLDTASRIIPDFTFPDARSVELPLMPAPSRGNVLGLASRAERIAEKYSPAYVLVDSDLNVLHFSGKIGRFLEPSGGAATLNLLNLVHPDLRFDIREALVKAQKDGSAVEAGGVAVGSGSATVQVDLIVEPVPGQGSPTGAFLVLLKEISTSSSSSDAEDEGSPQRGERIRQLEGDLNSTRDRLQSVLEEYESTSEELKASNEEYQSLNEELQSANEELETSKEELQSVNEELTTVNGELAHRVQELGRANSDLKNLLESTQIATIFLDNELKVTSFTPAVTEIFHIVETDIGRPISHIRFRIEYDELQEDAQKVLRMLGTVDREVVDAQANSHYMVRVLPYRSTDNYIGGVVITFTDVTDISRARKALRESQERQNLLIAELQHRTRNLLTVVKSIASQLIGRSGSLEEFKTRFDDMLGALSRVQSLLSGLGEGDRVSIEQLVRSELAAVGAFQDDKSQVSLEGREHVPLRSSSVQTLALALHELATNSVKYGSLSGAGGSLKIMWMVEEVKSSPPEEWLRLEWIETFLDEHRAKASSMASGKGRQLIERALPYQLGAETKLDISSKGVRCLIRLRISRPGNPS